MLINFIIPPGQDPSNRWRNLFALSVMIIGVILTVGPHVGIAKPVVEASNKILPKIVPSYQSKNTFGGDITVAAPRPLPPPLPIPVLVGQLPSSTAFTAKSMFVKDVASNKVLYAKDEYTARPIASITKLMSALVLMEKSIQWVSSTVVIEGEFIDNHMYAGDTYTFEELWNAALVASSNKAVMTLVKGTGWEVSPFVARMNEKAAELGMTNTQFVEPTGLDEGNVSTASDVALLLNAALKKEKIQQTLTTKEYALFSAERNKTHQFWNTNWLLLNWVPQKSFDITGGKTGYIIASGYNFAVQLKNQSQQEITVVILGADTHEGRFSEARDVGSAIFEAYQWPE